MSITALVTGKLIAAPEQRTGASGKPYVRATLAAHDGDADSLVSVMAFGSAAEQLAALAKGDTVAINGRAKVSTWTGRDGSPKSGLNVTADVVLTAYQLKQKRKALAPAAAEAPAPRASAGQGDDFGDGPDPWLDGGRV
ncbi:MAG: single-stranded DNA-binding protein [Pseudomonadota bacterium]|nr:single-stranded DNA-binding protein [Pseudomonadota bacterium]